MVTKAAKKAKKTPGHESSSCCCSSSDHETIKKKQTSLFAKIDKNPPIVIPKMTPAEVAAKLRSHGLAIGAHISAAGGVSHIFERSREIGATASAFFLRSQRKWTSTPLAEKEITAFKKELELQKKEHGSLPLLPHGTYLANLAGVEEDKYEKSISAVLDEVERCYQLGITRYNLHPGTVLGKGDREQGFMQIAKSLIKVHETLCPKYPEQDPVTIVLECMAGQGGTVCVNFKEMYSILKHAIDVNPKYATPEHIAFCIDTCHIHSAGHHDIRTQKTYEKTMAEFETTFSGVGGWNRLAGFHLNDSMGEFGCLKDRHENIGKGFIGIEAFRCIVNDDRLKGIPMVLETPLRMGKDGKEDFSVYAEELALLSSLIK